MAEHFALFLLPQSSSKLSTSTTTVQKECELKSARICSPRRQFGAKLCEYVPLAMSLHFPLPKIRTFRFSLHTSRLSLHGEVTIVALNFAIGSAEALPILCVRYFR